MQDFEFQIGHTICTPDGVGTLISIVTPFDSLQYDFSRATYTVWYGLDSPQNGWVSRDYDYNELFDYDDELKYSYKMGYKTGLHWTDSYRPGGPFFSKDDSPEAKRMKQLNQFWLAGFDEGLQNRMVELK